MEDKYVGDVEAGIGVYELPFHLLFKYNYDFARSDSNWGVGVDTALYFGGYTTQYVVAKNNKVTRERKGTDGLILAGNMDGERIEEGIGMVFGHDLGFFLRRYVSKSFAMLIRGGINNVLTLKSRLKGSQSKRETEVTSEFSGPNFYLSTGIEFYL